MGILSRFQKQHDAEKKPAVEQPAVTAPAVAASPAVRHEGTKKSIAWQVLSKPLVSEKAALLAHQNQYVFLVSLQATKSDVRRAVLEAYGVRPLHVTMARVRGKKVRYERSVGVTKVCKKATVTLPKDKKIQIYEGV